jgi:protease-4
MGKVSGFLTSLRVWTVNLFTLGLLLYIIVVVGLVLRQMPEKVDPQGRVLILSPEGLILDQRAFPAEFNFPFGMQVEKQVQSRDLVKIIRAAAVDERLAAILIDFSKASFSGPSTALNIASELAALRGSGKPVIAFSERLTSSSYMMAAQADEIYVHPSGSVSISGIGGYRDYTRELTDKLKINIHNYSQGDYKSAVEGFTRTDMSDSDRLQREELYQPIWAALKARMASGRGLDAQFFQDMADNHAVVLFDEAAYDNLALVQQKGLIDGTMGFPDLRAYMIEKFGRDEDAERETYPHIGADAYFAQLEPEDTELEDAVAVVFAEGTIQEGKLGPGVAGADDIARLIRQAHEDESTRALVLRVNSPGGGVIASDIIRDELVAARSKDLPVFVSMGDVAASGGVWISTPADTIYAEPTTITGSIGVAILFPTLEKVYDYLGINSDGVTTSEFAGWDLNRGVDERLDAIFARWASSSYRHFVDTVAADRGREPDYIRSIAGGRIWIADKALELGLIDELGDLDDAIAAAAAQAQLEDYRVNYVVKEMPAGLALLQRFTASMPIGVSAVSPVFADRVARLLELAEGISQPRATVMCTDCQVELL